VWSCLWKELGPAAGWMSPWCAEMSSEQIHDYAKFLVMFFFSGGHVAKSRRSELLTCNLVLECFVMWHWIGRDLWVVLCGAARERPHQPSQTWNQCAFAAKWFDSQKNNFPSARRNNMTLDMLQSWNHHDIAEGMQRERGLESMGAKLVNRWRRINCSCCFNVFFSQCVDNIWKVVATVWIQIMQWALTAGFETCITIFNKPPPECLLSMYMILRRICWVNWVLRARLIFHTLCRQMVRGLRNIVKRCWSFEGRSLERELAGSLLVAASGWKPIAQLTCLMAVLIRCAQQCR
jgi:hypothetical protein